MRYPAAFTLLIAASLMACGNADHSTHHGADHSTHQGAHQGADTEHQNAEHVGAEHVGVMVDNPIIRPPLPGRNTAMATMRLMNHSNIDDRLIEVRSEAGGEAEIHTMLNEDGIMKMRRIENGIELLAGKTHSLKSGGDHVMIFNTQIPSDIKTVGLVLVFEKAGDIHVQARVDDGSLNNDSSHSEEPANDHSHH